MQQIKLIALDMDGTLLQDDQHVSEYTKSIITEALQQGIQVVLCTGRALEMCYDYAMELGMSTYIIACNGAEIWTVDQELIERHPLQAETVEKLWHLGNEQGYHMWSVAADKSFRDATRPDDFYEHEWLKHGYGNLDTRAKSYLLETLAHNDSIEITNSSPHNLEVNQLGVHKAQAIQSLCERSNISMNEVMAIGDSMNDFKMLEQVGLGVAVRNAQEEILDLADVVTTSNNNDGVATAIKRYALS